MKYLINNNNTEIVFYENELQKAKEYYLPNSNILIKENYIGNNYESYVKQYKDYIDAICTCNDIVELCDVLNRYTDLFNNGTNFKIKEI